MAAESSQNGLQAMPFWRRTETVVSGTEFKHEELIWGEPSVSVYSKYLNRMPVRSLNVDELLS